MSEEKSEKRLDVNINTTRQSETGTIMYEGVIINDEYVPDLIGSQKYTVYERMERSSSTVSEVLRMTSLPLISAEWGLTPASQDKKDLEVQEMIEHLVFKGMNIPWLAALEGAIECLQMGHFEYEKVYKYVMWNGREVVGIDLYSIGQKTIQAWRYQVGEKWVNGIHQLTETGHEAFIPEEDILRFTYRQRGDDYEGRSLLRAAYPHWYHVNQFYRISGAAYERTAMGIPVITTPAGLKKEDQEKAEQLAKNFRANENSFAVIPHNYNLEILDPKANNQMDPLPLVEHHTTQIARAGLSSFMHLGQAQNGSRAASYDQSTIFEKSIESIGQMIAEVFQKGVIEPLVDYNFPDIEEYPQIKVTGISRDHIEAMSDALHKLAQVDLITPDEGLEAHIRKIMKLPAKPEGAATTIKKDMETKEQGDRKKATAGFVATVDTGAQPIKGVLFHRPFTAAEKKTNFLSIQRRIEKGERILQEYLGDLNTEQISGLMGQVKKALESDTPLKNLQNITPGLGAEYNAVIVEELTSLFEYAKVTTADEMEAILGKGKVNAPGTNALEKSKIAFKADTLTTNNAAKLSEEAAILASELHIAGRSSDEIVILVSRQLKESAKKRTKLSAAASVIGSINQGRTFTQETNGGLIYAYQYSAILDAKTCPTCLALDGKVVATNDPAYKQLMPPQHFNCRCIWVEILTDELDPPPITGVPDEIDRDSSLGNFKQVDKNTL